jgi:hypothetical protein
MAIGRLAHSPVRPTWPQVVIAASAPPARVDEKIASTCCRLRHSIGLSLVHEHAERVDGAAHRGRLVAVAGLEFLDLGAAHRARHRAELGGALDQRGRGGARPAPWIWTATFG